MKTIIKKLDIIPVFEDLKYFCSENSVSTVLKYYGINILPRNIHSLGCIGFDSINTCLPDKFVRKPSTFQDLMISIKNNNPVLISIIPDNNLKTMERHTVVIYGITHKNVLIIDNGKKRRVNWLNLDRVWKRTNNDSYISKLKIQKKDIMVQYY